MEILKLIDILAWPLTVLIVLFGFKKYVAGVIKRIGSIQAGAGGISLTFSEQIEQAKSRLAELKRPESTSTKKISSTLTPAVIELNRVKKSFTHTIHSFAQKQGVKVENKSLYTLVEHLKDEGYLHTDTANMIFVVEQVLQKATPAVTMQQVEELKLLVNEIDLK